MICRRGCVVRRSRGGPFGAYRIPNAWLGPAVRPIPGRIAVRRPGSTPRSDNPRVRASTCSFDRQTPTQWTAGLLDCGSQGHSQAGRGLLGLPVSLPSQLAKVLAWPPPPTRSVLGNVGAVDGQHPSTSPSVAATSSRCVRRRNNCCVRTALASAPRSRRTIRSTDFRCHYTTLATD